MNTVFADVERRLVKRCDRPAHAPGNRQVRFGPASRSGRGRTKQQAARIKRKRNPGFIAWRHAQSTLSRIRCASGKGSGSPLWQERFLRFPFPTCALVGPVFRCHASRCRKAGGKPMMPSRSRAPVLLAVALFPGVGDASGATSEVAAYGPISCIETPFGRRMTLAR